MEKNQNRQTKKNNLVMDTPLQWSSLNTYLS